MWIGPSKREIRKIDGLPNLSITDMVCDKIIISEQFRFYESTRKETELMASQELNRVAMVIVPHADDAEFMAAGTVATWVKDGWEVYYVICTNGGGGGPDDAQDVSMEARQKIIDTRKIEQERAAAVLGVKKVIFLGYPDSQLEPR